MDPTTFYTTYFFPSICQIVTSIPTSERSAFWLIIGLLGFWGWVAVIIAFLIWGAIELTLRPGKSANGCTWEFNVAVGSFTFAVFQSITYLFFSKLFEPSIYCTIWPNLSYLLVFPLVWLFLRGIGFWVY